jgi:hypothetical protein
MCVSPWPGRNQGAKRSRVGHPASICNAECGPATGSPFGPGCQGWLRGVALLAQANSLGCAVRLPQPPLAPRRTSDFSVSLD